MKKYQKLREVIQKANPEIKKREILYRCNRIWEAWQYKTIEENDFEEVNLSENITLADVLLALNKNKSGVAIQDFGCFMLSYELGEYIDWQEITHNRKRCYWNLKDNNLDNQSNETLTFIYDLLVR
jgi:hypothetical protein